MMMCCVSLSLCRSLELMREKLSLSINICFLRSADQRLEPDNEDNGRYRSFVSLLLMQIALIDDVNRNENLFIGTSEDLLLELATLRIRLGGEREWRKRRLFSIDRLVPMM